MNEELREILNQVYKDAGEKGSPRVITTAKVVLELRAIRSLLELLVGETGAWKTPS